VRMSKRPEPHRISLARGWKYSKDWQRFFHKPTNLCQQSVVRLRIESDRALQSARLNGLILPTSQEPAISQEPASSPTSDSGAEISFRFGYDWEITSAVRARNELVLGWPNPDPKTQESEPQIEVWLEIFDP
jgi:hypothetical protein